MKIQKIPLSQVDLSDETFSINFHPDLKILHSSISELGLIQPVLLREKGERYQIISGFRRIAVLNELGIPDVPSRIFNKDEKDELQFFSIALHENMTTRGLNSVEKAIALYKLIYIFKIEPSAVIQTYLPLLYLEPNEKILNTYLSLAKMEEEVKDYVLREEVSRSNIRRLSNLLPEERMALIPFLSSLKLGENRLKEILMLLEEISQRNQLKIGEILCKPELQTILSQNDMTPSQKTERVKKLLLNIRYPRFSQLEKSFEKRRRDLNLPPHISLHHQPYFEGKGLSIEFRFETIKEYQEIISFLSQLNNKNEFQEMIKGT